MTWGGPISRKWCINPKIQNLCLFIGKNLHISSNKVNDFALSFENAKCYEYITEKFFTALEVGMLPVVMGGLSKQDYEKIAPPHSFIHVDDFSSPMDLMKFLSKLSRNPEEYNSYFWWNLYYDISIMSPNARCNLCHVLNSGKVIVPTKKYLNFAAYWNKCR